MVRVGVVAGCVIRQDGMFLLVQEKNPKVYGLWNVPAGHVDEGETIEEAAVREAKEETGFEVTLDHEVGVHHGSATESVLHIFAANITGGELAIDPSEVLDAQWFTYDEIESLHEQQKLRAPWVFTVITIAKTSCL